MDLNELLKRLEEHKIYVEEERKFHEGTRVLIFRCRLPQMPHGHQNAWATLTLEPNQTTVEREEIQTILRHLCHASTAFFGDELEQELKPTDQHEMEIATYVDTKARAVQKGAATWNDNIIDEVKVAVGFQLSDAEIEYLDAYLRWRKSNPPS